MVWKKKDVVGCEDRVVNEYGDGVAWLRGSMLGKGGFGSVYLATLKNPGSKYSYFPSVMAVKSAEISVSGSIQKEREVLSNVRGCPDVIRCFGEETTIGCNGAMVYNLLLEYGSGGTLADRIKKYEGKGLPEFEAKLFTRSILRGLKHVHGLGYVHCDLKPDNILLVSDSRSKGFTEFRAKIGDFGLAKRVKQRNKRKLEPYWRGTPMYLSPEAVMESVQEPSSDVWALGCIVLEMLTGKPPWHGENELNAEKILSKIGVGKELPKIPNEISKDARDFLKGCFVRNPRFRLTAEMLLNHGFVDGLYDYDDIAVEESEEIGDFNDIESVLLVSESDGEFGCDLSPEGDSFYYWSEEDEENVDVDGYWSEEDEENVEVDDDFSEGGESEVEEIKGVTDSSTDTGFDQTNKKPKQMPPESKQHFPVSFTIPAGV